MDCIEYTNEEADERVLRFVAGEMPEVEEDEFQLHLMQCMYCMRSTKESLTAISSIKEVGRYEDLCAAYDAENWEEVIRLGDEMREYGYSEELHPIEEIYLSTVKKGLAIYSDDNKLPLSFSKHSASTIISRASTLSIYLFSKEIYHELFSNDHLFVDDYLLNAAHKHTEMELCNPNGLSIKLLKGRNRSTIIVSF